MAGRPRLSVGRLVEAWVRAYGHGLDAWLGTATAWGATGHSHEVVAQRAIRLYEATAAAAAGLARHRPGCARALASQGRADSLAGDVAQLLILAKQMRAAERERSPARHERQTRRAQRRATPQPGRLNFRRTDGARWETPEQFRQRIRDLLLTGKDPTLWPNAALAAGRALTGPLRLTGPDRYEALDGVGARVLRYRADLERPRYRLSPNFPHLTERRERQGGLTA